MTQSLIYILLLSALALPVLGAVLLRVLYSRMTLPQFYGVAGGIFVIALASVLLLAGSDAPSLQIGNLSILLPASAPEDMSAAVPVGNLPVTGATLEEPTADGLQSSPAGATTAALATAEPTIAPAPTAAATAEPTAAATAEPTTAPTDVPAPTAAPTDPPAPPAPSGLRKYTVQPGDTLRSIAEQFNVSVKALLDANKLTSAQADSLRVGQELVIPSS